MPLPGDLTTITVTATYPDGSGNPLFGYVTFTPSADLTDSTGHVILRAAPITVNLVRGAISQVLVCTDNATISPSGWYWVVTEVVGTASGNLVNRTYNVFLPHTLGSTVDLSTLVPVSPGAPVSTLYGVLAATYINTWLSSQVFSGGVKIPTGAANGDVLTSDASGNATWQAPVTGGIQPPAGDIGGTVSTPTVVGVHFTVPIGNGGTGGTSQQGAINALTGTQGAGKYLRSDGANAALSTIQAADVPTLNQSTTGTAANVTGTVAIANGGTNATGAAAALQNLGAVASTWCDMLGFGLLTAPLTDTGYSSTQSAGDLVCCLVNAPKTATVGTLGIQVTGAGVTGSGVNALALFTEAGVLIDQTGDMTTAFSSVQYAEGAMGSSHTVSAGANYYLVVLSHFSGTAPKFAATGTTQTSNFPVVNGHYIAVFRSGQASIPSSFTPSSFTLNSGQYIMYAR